MSSFQGTLFVLLVLSLFTIGCTQRDDTLEQEFDSFDLNNNGVITVDELADSMYKNKGNGPMSLTMEQAHKLAAFTINKYNINGDGLLTKS